MKNFGVEKVYENFQICSLILVFGKRNVQKDNLYNSCLLESKLNLKN